MNGKRRRKILVVEDSVLLAEHLTGVLDSLDFGVLGPVDNGRAAVALALEAVPDLILMDVNLAGRMDGIEAARRIREQRNIPVIYLTAHTELTLLDRAKSTAPMSYLVKPFRTEDLFTNIEIALHRHQLERKLQQSQARFAGILATASDAIIGADSSGSIQLFNNSAERMFGYEAGQVIGQPLDRLVEPKHGPLHGLALPDQMVDSTESELHHPRPATGRHRNGHRFPAEIAVSRFATDSETLFIAVIRDVSEQKRAELAMQRYATRLEQINAKLTALGQVALRLQRTRNLDEVLATLGHGLHNLDITCVVTRTVARNPAEQVVYYTSLPAAVRAQIKHWLGRELTGLAVRPPERLRLTDEAYVSVAAPDILDALPFLQEDSLETVKNLLGIDFAGEIFSLPLRSGKELFGNLVIWGGDLKSDTISSYQIFASQVAIALENARLLEAERQAREQAEALQEVATVLNASLKVEEVLRLILRQVGRVIAYDSASLMLVKGKYVEIVARIAGRRTPGKELPNLIPLAAVPGIQELLARGRAVFIADTRSDSRWVDLAEDYSIRSWMGVPIMSGEEIIGILNLDHLEAGFYTEQDAQLAEAFAAQAKLAVENARLFARTQQHAEELEQRVEARTRNLSALYEVTSAINRHRSLDKVLKRALQSMLQAVEASAGLIHLRGEGMEKPFLVLDVEKCASLEYHIDPKSPTIEAVRGILAGKPLQIVTGVVPGDGQKYTTAVIPMPTGDSVAGVLTLIRCSRDEFSIDDFALAVSVAEHLAVAVESADLRRRAEQAAVAAERERLARDLHDSVTQQLYSLTLFAEAAQEKARRGQIDADYMTAISATAQQALREMRLLLYELRADMFSHDGLAEALRFRLDAVEQRAGLEARLHAALPGQLPAEVEEGLYRIAQEALNNVLKHANATAVAVHLRRHQEGVRLEVHDNGSGFDQSAIGKGGMGLANMQERALRLGGELLVDSWLGHGTRVKVNLPLDGAAHTPPERLSLITEKER